MARGDRDRVLDGLFSVAVILPSQYLADVHRQTSGSLQPEKKLMLAVLEDGVAVFQKYAFMGGPRAREEFRETANWIDSDDRFWPYSFANLCEALGIEHEYLRRGLWAWRERERRRTLSQTTSVGSVS